MNNSFYGKTCENIRDRCEIKLCKKEQEVEKYVNIPNFRKAVKLQDKLYVLMNNITSVTFNKPICTGICILDYSKLLMYKFFYETNNVIWPNNKVLFYDTDSYFLNIFTDGVYEDMKQIQNDLDTSDYSKDHPLYSEDNKKVIGKFKVELARKVMRELIALRSKEYSYLVNDEEKKKLKGICRNVVKKQITHQNYEDTVLNEFKKINYDKMYRLNSINHEMFIQERN